jgi:hypothetical protein
MSPRDAERKRDAEKIVLISSTMQAINITTCFDPKITRGLCFLGMIRFPRKVRLKARGAGERGSAPWPEPRVSVDH